MHSKFNMCYAFTYQEVRFWRCSDRDAAIGSAKKKKMDFGSRLEPSDSIAESVPEWALHITTKAVFSCEKIEYNILIPTQVAIGVMQMSG